MSAMSEMARAKAKTKVERLVRSDPKERVDASGYQPSGLMGGDIQTGPRPISRRAFKSGGKVLGEVLKARADRMPRKSGGRALVDDFQNRDMKEANPGSHVGGYARGGSPSFFADEYGNLNGEPKRYGPGNPNGPAKSFEKQLSSPDRKPMSKYARMARDTKAIKGFAHGGSCTCAKCGGGRVGRASGGYVDGPDYSTARTGNLRKAWSAAAAAPRGSVGEKYKGKIAQELVRRPPFTGQEEGHTTITPYRRVERASGGRAKKGMNVNIVIAPSGGGGSPPAMPPPGIPSGGGPVGLHQGMPPAPVPPPGAAPPMGPPPPMRKDGGAVVGHFAKPGKYPIKNAAGGGKGRLQKARAYG